MLKPIGVFGSPRLGDIPIDRLTPLVGALPHEERTMIARYLRAGTVVIALMEYTKDVISGRFSVPGGSGILTDGTFYWRGDLAEYVETYGIGLDPTAIETMRTRDWVPPEIAPERLMLLDEELTTEFRGSSASSA